MSSCATVEIFLDSFDEVVEQFSVTITSDSDGVLISHSGDLVVTITDEGTSITVLFEAFCLLCISCV